MDIGRRYHRLADADRIGQRTARDLRRVEIGRRVDIRRLQIIDQFVMVDEGIDGSSLFETTALTSA